MSNHVNVNFGLRYYLQNPQSREARAFFEGARSMMTTLQLAPASEYASILSTSNQQHIIALLAKSEAQQNARRREDVRQMLKIYQWNPLELYAFIFNLSKVNANGRAMDNNGCVVENEMFQVLPGKKREVWPSFKIEHVDSGRRISYDEYLALDEAQRDDYIYRRYFQLKLDGQPALRIADNDYYLMEELIRQCILGCSADANRRFMVEVYNSADKCEVGQLYHYREAIFATLDELSFSQPMLLTQIKAGYIMSAGQLEIAKLQQLAIAMKAKDLLDSDYYTINRWTKIISAYHHCDMNALGELITTDDIYYYRNVSGNSMNKAVPDKEQGQWKLVCPSEYDYTPEIAKEHFFVHIFMPKVTERLWMLIDRILTSENLALGNISTNMIIALKTLYACLLKIYPNNSSNALTNKPAANEKEP